MLAFGAKARGVALRTILLALGPMLERAARRQPAFRALLRRHDVVAQIQLKDGSIARHFVIRQGRVRTAAGAYPQPDIRMSFKDVRTALAMMRPSPDMRLVVHAAKTFKVQIAGPDHLAVWWMQLLNAMQKSTLTFGRSMTDGTRRFTNLTNGGPLFVYVKGGRIVRTEPIAFDDTDAGSWTIVARGKRFAPRRAAMIAPHALAMRSTVYSSRRLLYPMKRVDFDPGGARNPHMRGISGYQRISWEEALDIVAAEIRRQKRVHGAGSICIPMSSHHLWGNVGYYLSSLTRFGNLIGFTRVAANPDSWEGWYWGAMHHWGHSQRVGVAANYGTIEDCLQNAELIVFWSSDPESTNVGYAGMESTQRRMWAKELGIEFIHIDPHYNPCAQLFGGRWLPIRPGSDGALAIAIMYVWIAENLYDADYVAARTTGFEEWKDYVVGRADGVPKTPEWQESATGIPARDVRALARLWARKRTYLSCGASGTGFGGAGRGANGAQWARCMVMLMAMRGLGKPGINMGGLMAGAPVDHEFYFPGYADGGISGELQWNGNAVYNYQMMPHVLTVNPVRQLVPRQQLPEAIIKGSATGYLWDGMAPEIQFAPYTYPMPGYPRIHMLYKYGGSWFSTLTESQRMAQAYRHESIECVVNQSIWNEGETQFADVILPACTNLERWDIGEWCSGGGYLLHGFNAVNHRVIVLQHKCMEPLGESKSDYEIFSQLLQRLGLGAVFTEGCSELDWVKRVFDSSDLPQHVSWEEFCRKGYFVVPAEKEELRQPVNFRWFAEGRPKDIAEPQPLPSQWAESPGVGLQTPSGKIEFIPTNLRRFDANNPERPVVNRYRASWEGPGTAGIADRYPLQLIAVHSRYSFHTHADGKGSAINNVEDHRACVGGRFFYLLRINDLDARERAIGHRDLVKIWNDRGAVICAADVSPLMSRGVVRSIESSAEYEMVEVDGEIVEVGGCLNVLTPSRPQSQGTSGMAPNSCMVQVERWRGAASFLGARAAAASGARTS